MRFILFSSLNMDVMSGMAAAIVYHETTSMKIHTHNAERGKALRMTFTS